ncbi:alpha/beta hydrolase [Catenulispora rubra]|uniref:alpha/beta hydrolase n=1 Tax=Catenulispora rubra TaxID=280293 RepID=UPI0018920D70|nr:alpha/beta hydrolase [Catenulispora rubra]
MSAEAWTEREREYSPSSMVRSLTELTDRYRTESERVRREVPYRTYSYGRHASETLDFFASGLGSAAHVFVHGGYWQDLSKDDSSFPAAGFHRLGTSYISVNYGLAPAFSLEAIIDQVVRAVRWIGINADGLGIDRHRIVLSGSSAGAHLAAAAVLRDVADSRDAGGAADRGADVPVAGLILLSGIYDLQPLVGTYINDAVGLDADTSAILSPAMMLEARPDDAPGLPPLLACWGEHETATFKRESIGFADRWRRHGGSAVATEIADRNHFDIVHDLAEPASQLGALIHSQTREWQWP